MRLKLATFPIMTILPLVSVEKASRSGFLRFDLRSAPGQIPRIPIRPDCPSSPGRIHAQYRAPWFAAERMLPPPDELDRPRHWYDLPVYLTLRVLICVVQALPPQTSCRLARRLAWLCADVLSVRGKLVDDNLRLALPHLSGPERRRLARRMWEHLFLLVIEVALTPRKIHETNWRRYIKLVNMRQLVAPLLGDRPVVLVSGHYGNFELSSYLLGMLGFPSFTVARPLDNRYLDRYLNRFRGASGQQVLPKSGSGGRIDALLERGATLAVLGDQHAGPKGCWVEFFGRPASTHKAIALFALGNNAPLVVCYARRVGGILEHEVGVEGVADVRDGGQWDSVQALTQWYTRRLEDIIRRGPEQYWWLHRRWREPKPSRKGAGKRAA